MGMCMLEAGMTGEMKRPMSKQGCQLRSTEAAKYIKIKDSSK